MAIDESKNIDQPVNHQLCIHDQLAPYSRSVQHLHHCRCSTNLSLRSRGALTLIWGSCSSPTQRHLNRLRPRTMASHLDVLIVIPAIWHWAAVIMWASAWSYNSATKELHVHFPSFKSTLLKIICHYVIWPLYSTVYAVDYSIKLNTLHWCICVGPESSRSRHSRIWKWRCFLSHPRGFFSYKTTGGESQVTKP